jgi:hypothetical protein
LTSEPSQPESFQPQSPEQEFLYSQTDRPNEPITHGAPFGPGPSLAVAASESPQETLQRIGQQVGESAYATPEVQAFLHQIQNGE